MDDIDLLLYMPASFVCDVCGFQLEKRTMNPVTGQVGIRKGGEVGGVCPNDGQTMRRMTWKEAFEDMADSSHELMLALIESVKLQSHYAGLLNMHDGGKRLQFDSPAAWIQRLHVCGTLPTTSKPTEGKGPIPSGQSSETGHVENEGELSRGE